MGWGWGWVEIGWGWGWVDLGWGQYLCHRSATPWRLLLLVSARFPVVRLYKVTIHSNILEVDLCTRNTCTQVSQLYCAFECISTLLFKYAWCVGWSSGGSMRSDISVSGVESFGIDLLALSIDRALNFEQDDIGNWTLNIEHQTLDIGHWTHFWTETAGSLISADEGIREAWITS